MAIATNIAKIQQLTRKLRQGAGKMRPEDVELTLSRIRLLEAEYCDDISFLDICRGNCGYPEGLKP